MNIKIERIVAVGVMAALLSGLAPVAMVNATEGAQRKAASRDRSTASRPTRQSSAGREVRREASPTINYNADRNRNMNVNNNVNIDRDVNIDVDVDHHGHGDGWYDNNDHWHPVATVAAVAVTAAVVGSIVNDVPSSGCQTVIVNGYSYYQCGNTWYQPQYYGSTVQYIVVVSPR